MADSAPAPSVTTWQRRWSLAAAICAVTTFGLAIGQFTPLMSLLLNARGIDPTVNGLNAAAAFLGVLIGPLLTPRGVRLLGIRKFLLLAFALEIAETPMLKLFDSLGAWFVLRAFGGMLGSAIFTASEAWINRLAGNAGRGRILALYVAALSIGFGIGPLLLTLTGLSGWPPFLANMAILAVAVVPLLGVGDAAREFGRERTAHPFAMLRRAPLILLSVTLFGVYEATVFALLPIWGVRLGLSPGSAAATVSAIYFGSAALQLPVGWLSDKTARLTMLRLCAGAGLAGAIAIALLAAPGPGIFVLIAVWGGVTSSIYAVALSMAGDRFRDADLVSVNAAIIMAYGMGALIGPGLGGAAMDLRDPQGLFWFFIGLFAVFLATACWPRRAST